MSLKDLVVPYGQTPWSNISVNTLNTGYNVIHEGIVYYFDNINISSSPYSPSSAVLVTTPLLYITNNSATVINLPSSVSLGNYMSSLGYGPISVGQGFQFTISNSATTGIQQLNQSGDANYTLQSYSGVTGSSPNSGIVIANQSQRDFTIVCTGVTGATATPYAFLVVS